MVSAHALRERSRTELAPRLAGFAVFLGISLALLAAGAQGPLASAQAGGAPGPVLGGDDPPAGEPVVTEPETPVDPVEPLPELADVPPAGERVPAEPITPSSEPVPTEPGEPPVEPPVEVPEEPLDPPVEPPPPAEPPPVEQPTRPLPVDERQAAPEPPPATPPGQGDQIPDPGPSDDLSERTPDPVAGANGLVDVDPDGRRQSAAQRTAAFRARTGLTDPDSQPGASGTELALSSLAAAPSAAGGGFMRIGADERGGDGGVAGPGQPRIAADELEDSAVTRTVRDIVEVVPDSLKIALAALAALSVLLGAGYLLSTMRARQLARQRRELLQEVGLLQTALLPPVPARLGALKTSVAYRPADGPGAGGDFYDALPLPGGRVGFILGDVSGHGRGALARTAFMRYTLRAYLEAGLEPRVALQVAGRVIDENLGGDFATVLLAVHDPETGSLTYATAGHPAPIVVGPQPHDPVTASSSPPIGVGERTGLRQTTVPLVPGSVACLFTDGLIEARTDDGMLGRERLTELLDELGPEATAGGLIEKAAEAARVSGDDIAAVVVSPTAGVTTGLFRTEQLELSTRELQDDIARRFLESCGLPADEVDRVEQEARQLADRFGGVVLHVVFGNRRRVEVLPRNVESIEAASRRSAAR